MGYRAPLTGGAEERAHAVALKMALKSLGKMTAMEAMIWAR